MNARLPRRAAVNRADLLLALDQWGGAALERLAPTIGYQRQTDTTAATAHDNPTEPAPEPPPTRPPAPMEVPPPAPMESRPPPARFVDPTFYRIVAYREVAAEAATVDRAELAETQPLDLHGRHQGGPLPPWLPLALWSKLWPCVKALLGEQSDTRHLNTRRITEQIAHQAPLTRLPRLTRTAWARNAYLIVDFNRATEPFWEDQRQLVRLISRWRGTDGLRIRVMEDGPAQGWRPWGQAQAPFEPCHPSATAGPLLLLTDLGCLEQSGRRRHHWLRFGRQCRAAGLRPVVLAPAKRWVGDHELNHLFTIFSWDHNSHFPPRWSIQSARPPQQLKAPDQGVQALLTLLSPLLRVEPGLLRAARRLLPVNTVDVETEASIWSHPEVDANPLAFAFKAGAAQPYRQAFGALSPAALRLALPALIQRHHAGLAAAIRYEELATCFDLLDDPSHPHLQAQIEDYQRRMAATLWQNRQNLGAVEGLVAYVRRYFGRQNPGIWQSPWACAAWAITHEQELRAGVALPPGLSLNQVAPFLTGASGGRYYSLYQQGARLMLAAATTRERAHRQATPISRVWLAHPFVAITRQTRANRLTHGLELNAREEAAIPLQANARLTLTFSGAALTIAPFTKPGWAERIGFDHYGLYAEFSYGGVTQRVRWLNPGKFTMGSPASEPGRRDNETQHEVILSQGFWLAETACTQALWRAVMGDNPSRFQGDNRPVERVSWDEARTFIQRLNQRVPGLQSRLPTEAEWEYACRAGTTTPFSFGDSITPEQAKYGGHDSYGRGKQWFYRKATADVKTLPPNPWGLYEMHGNVREWCEDWYQQPYEEDDGVNPGGPSEGVARVLRGGSWFSLGGYVRSAYRDGIEPGYRNDSAGFRLAQGQKPTGGA